ncbi:MAG: hypothetical protein GXO26_08040 [Crenarchaeota archaeon]|nr:hypothetical protein [Thermoproteota archaeon]
MSIFEKIARLSEERYREDIVRMLREKCREVDIIDGELICRGCLEQGETCTMPRGVAHICEALFRTYLLPKLCDVRADMKCRIVKTSRNGRLILELVCEEI